YIVIAELINPIIEADIEIEVQDFKIRLHNSLKLVANVIEESKYLMELKDDWDGEGGGKVAFETWKKAISFIVDYSTWLYNNYQIVIVTPQISPGPESSIDLLWRSEQYRLLVNIPDNPEQP